MSGKCIRVVNNSQSKWKHVPIMIGGGAPKRNDLIEFEELENYVTESADIQEHDLKSKSKKLKKNQQLKQNKKLPKVNKMPRKDVNIHETKSENTSENRAKKLPKKRKTNSTQKAKKQKLSLLTEVTSSDDIKKLPKKRKANSAKKAKKQKLSLTAEAPTDDVSCTDVEIKMSQWSGLNISPLILKALCELGFYSPLPIQKEVMHGAIAEKRDILGAAETGSGKTLAFGIPLLQHLMEDKARKSKADENLDKENSQVTLEINHDEDFEIADLSDVPRQNEKYLPALVLTPTRELALQIMKHLKKAAKYCSLWIVAVVGGMAPQKQIRLLKKGPDIVVATPGRMWELMNSDIAYLSQMHLLSYLVIDEADRMLEQGHFEDLTKVLEFINTKDSAKRQTFVFSATLTTTHVAPFRSKQTSNRQLQTKEVKLSKLMKKIGVSGKPHIVDLTTKKVVAEALSEGKIICEHNNKDFYLYYFFKSFPGRTLVFANSIDCIFRLSALFELLGCKPMHIHAKMQQRQRLKHLERFQEQPNAIMFASDVAARGLDIPNVRHVIHYQTPRTMETYVHRSGRCARSGKEGYALMLISPQELNLYKKLCRNLDRDDGIADFLMDDSYMGAVRKRVLLARQLDSTIHQQKKKDIDRSWFSKNASAIGVELDDDLVGKQTKVNKSLVLQQRKHLQTLLDTPLFPVGFSGKFLTKRGKLTTLEVDGNALKRK